MIYDKVQHVVVPRLLVVLPTISHAANVPSLLVVVLCLMLAYILVNELQRTKARITGLDGPRGLPIVGNIHQLRPDPAERLRQWSKIYGSVYQISMGNMPVVVFNSIQAAKDVFIGQGAALVDRPQFYTMHTAATTLTSSIGGSPWYDA